MGAPTRKQQLGLVLLLTVVLLFTAMRVLLGLL
jgi:hypothetical protein